MTLSAEERRRLSELADRLIPAEDGMPPGSVGLIEEVLAARPDLAEALGEVLRVPGDLTAAQTALAGEVVAGAYFLHPRVKDLIGYHGRRAVPIPSAPDYEDLLGPVVARGPVYREAP
ncbi:hypothetical protein [Actinomadura sp. DC4]|uniref:hypothetical protein n=1 Tax=Actinomadura sp. DC4 TaxID=3055069 RepID=UPI0025B0818E|nr:hypothetical protein [Actinomadura sp. DC4]MDN3355719.1 hypothetical protein [Actinomadura sp. DC4]